MMSCGRIPPLKATNLEQAGQKLYSMPGVLIVLGTAVCLSLGFVTLKGPPAQIGWFGLVLFVGCLSVFIAGPLAAVAAIVSYAMKRLGKSATDWKLPYGIATFRDLAELIAGDRSGWCVKCGYDLTGLASRVCPECGTAITHPTGD